jgi:putative DNA primase/helicase
MPSRPVERVLERVKNVTQLSAGWSAQCPAHEDHANSLSLAEGADGKALIFCHAGCAFEKVVDALGLRVRDLFIRQKGRRLP